MRNTFIILCLFLCENSSGQNADSILHLFANSNQEEKVYIHYDKDSYVAGETIWFKAYIYKNGQPGGLSSNFFLQLADENGNIISRKQYPISGATVRGDIDLPRSLPSGHYLVKAATPAMITEDGEMIYIKSLYVSNPRLPKPVKTSQINSPISIRFFPESGHLVAGIITVLGFKAVDEKGSPVEIKGMIKTEDGVNIVPFKTVHDGMGRLQFKPVAGKKYIAVLNEKQVFPLPDVQVSGINLNVEKEKGGNVFLITRSQNDSYLFDDLKLIAHMNRAVIYEQSFNFGQAMSAVGHLKTDNLPSGILAFTVFNRDEIPLAERLVFINNGEDEKNGEIIVEKKGMGSRQENILRIEFPEALERSCSVSITDMTGNYETGQENICSRLLLTDELKGTINKPGYYFSSNSEEVVAALDNVMLTHGWRRFNWSRILVQETPEKKHLESYLLNITGTVSELNNGQPMTGGNLSVFLSSEDSTLFTYEVPVKGNGRFIIDSLAIAGKTKIYYKFKDKKGKSKPVSISIDPDNFFERIHQQLSILTSATKSVFLSPIVEPISSQGHSYNIDEPDEATILENITVSASVKRPVDIQNEKYTSAIFRTGGKIVFDGIHFKPVDRAMSGLDYVKNRISTIDTQFGRLINLKNFSIQDNINPRNKGKRFWDVGVFINEMPANLIQLKVLRADQIVFVKFFEAGFLGSGSVYPGGALAVYVNYDNHTRYYEEKLNFFEFNGYSINKEFYNPDYFGPQINNSRKDSRSTLYWNPNIYTDTDTKSVKLVYYNNDVSKRFRVIVQGFDKGGNLIFIEKWIEGQ